MANKKYDYQFISELEDGLKCVICLEVAKEARQHELCGRLFCGDCIERNRSGPCPHCRAQSPTYFKDKRGDREIADLGVRCDNLERGCVWEGTVGTMDDHVNECGFTLVSCSNNCTVEGENTATNTPSQIVGAPTRDGAFIMRRDLEEHLRSQCPNRNYNCAHCGREDTYVSIMDGHDSVCEKKVIPCPNTECTFTFERGYKTQHVGSCEYTEVTCKYDSFGCTVKKMRKDMGEHEEQNDRSHLESALKKVSEVTNTISKLEETIFSQNELNVKILKGGEAITFKLEGFDMKKALDASYKSEPFYTSHGGYKMVIIVYPNGCDARKGTHMSISATILRGSYDTPHRLKGTAKVELLNQLSNTDHHSVTISYPADCQSISRCNSLWKFISHAEVFCNRNSDYGRTQIVYLMEDTLYFRVSVEVAQPWLVYTLEPHAKSS